MPEEITGLSPPTVNLEVEIGCKPTLVTPPPPPPLDAVITMSPVDLSKVMLLSPAVRLVTPVLVKSSVPVDGVAEMLTPRFLA